MLFAKEFIFQKYYWRVPKFRIKLHFLVILNANHTKGFRHRKNLNTVEVYISSPRITTKFWIVKAKNLLHSQASSRPCMYQIHRVFQFFCTDMNEDVLWNMSGIIMNNSVVVLKECMYGCSSSTTTVVDWRNVCKENRNERRVNFLGMKSEKENIFYFCFQDST